jgi:5-methylcytosine-specific restriction endonuclease McrA
MGKKFKRMTCVYCLDASATTVDHVFSREFFLVDDRDFLPEVPACKTCNQEKSRMEHYLTAVLPFGGRHPQARTNLEAAVPPRLAKNRRLNRELLASTKPAWIRQDGGIYQPTGTLEFDGKKLEALLKYIGRGLAWHHWKVYLRPSLVMT